MVLPNAGDDSRSEGASRIHAGAGVRDDAEVAESDCESDGEWSDEARVGFVLIGDAEHDQHEDKAEEEFESESLQLADVLTQVGVTEADAMRSIFNQNLQRCYRRHSASALRENVENRSQNRNATGRQKSNSDRRVDVASRNVSDGLRHKTEIIKVSRELTKRFPFELEFLSRVVTHFDDSNMQAKLVGVCLCDIAWVG